jgi:phosphatidate cytidylyltransferase
MKRLATWLVLTPVITWLVLAGPDWAFLPVVAYIGLIAFHEYNQIASGQRTLSAALPGMASGLALLLAPEPWIIVVLAAIVGMTLALRTADLANAAASAATFTLGVVYIFGALRCVLELRVMSHHWLMFALLAAWAGDTAALYVGRAFGRHPMAPRVSPAKSWEGAVGSSAGALLACGVYAHYLLPATPLGVVLALAAVGNVAAQVGDLFESALKRGAGVKDSGSILPGHGGWLDRIDASLFSVPVIYALLRAFPQLFSGSIA